MSVTRKEGSCTRTESSLPQAYDGHMNLILSDVEETIMIVDPSEGAPGSHTTVNVSRFPACILRGEMTTTLLR